MNFEDLTDEQKAKAKACNTPEELLALAKEEGYELGDEELDSVSGGGGWTTEELNNVAASYYQCKKLECNLFWCDTVTCPDFACNRYNNH